MAAVCAILVDLRVLISGFWGRGYESRNTSLIGKHALLLMHEQICVICHQEDETYIKQASLSTLFQSCLLKVVVKTPSQAMV